MIQFKSYASSSKANLYTIDDGITRLMIDSGLPWKKTQRLLDYNTSSIAGLLLDHFHADHSRSVVDAARSGIDVFASAKTIEHLNLSGHRVHVVIPMQKFVIGTWTIMAFETEHDAEGSLGFVMKNTAKESFLFVTDTEYVKYKFANLNVIAVECNYSLDLIRESVKSGAIEAELKNRIMKNHMSLETLIEFIKANDMSRVQEVHLLHLSSANSDAQLFKKRIAEIVGVPVFIA